MTNSFKAALLATALVPGFAFAQSFGDTLPVDEDALRAELQAQGYTIDEIETEDGEIEVTVTRDGTSYELELEGGSGTITEIELLSAGGDDDEDDDDEGADDDDDDQDDTDDDDGEDDDD